ncbi:hypothetical protein HMN09_00347700 [Mycena chlorophos]|uniref:DUF6534 domain-containing protein n=1 Tax=Mycena chlorophos TaxID=658473 RepID=A0A8H6TKK4_MYCCL|nr:hypothetical protein HMN09_00347700 [Mycena chlorophos]
MSSFHSPMATHPPGSIGGLDSAEILSAQLIGALLEFLLAGAFLVQLAIYRICFPRDSRAFKLLVYSLALLLLVRVCLTGYQTQHLFAAGYGNVEILFAVTKHQYSRTFAPIIVCIVQHFFSYRIFYLARRFWPVCILISILSLAQCGVGLAAFTLVYVGPGPGLQSVKTPLINDLGRAWYAGGVATALVNTLTTAFILFRVRSAYHTTQQAVRRLIRVTIESNAVSAALEVISLALLQAFPGDPYYVGASYLLSGVYSNMLLVSLNYRVLIRQQRASWEASTLSQAPQSVDLEKNHDRERRNTTSGPAGEQRESATIGDGSVGLLDGASSASVRISDSEDNSKRMRHSKTGTVEIRVEEERSVVRR